MDALPKWMYKNVIKSIGDMSIFTKFSNIYKYLNKVQSVLHRIHSFYIIRFSEDRNYLQKWEFGNSSPGECKTFQKRFGMVAAHT